MSHIISVVNNKGGVGKSTVTANLGHALTNRGLKVLLIDMDSQANLTDLIIGREAPEKTTLDLFDDIPIDQCIMPTLYGGVHLIASESELATIEPDYYGKEESSWSLIRRSVRDYALKTFDITLIDTPPNLGLFVLMSMIASDFVMVPVKCSSLAAVKGLSRTIDTIKKVQNTINPDLKILKILINQIDKRTAVSKALLELINDWYKPEEIFGTTISINTPVEQAELNKQTVIRHAPTSTATKQFRLLASELIELLGITPSK